MSAFLTPCRHPACGTATRNDSGYCDDCEPKATQERGQRPRAKRASGGAGYDVRHLRWRRRVLAEDPFCRWPLGDGRLCSRPATEADHVVPIAEWEAKGGSQYDLENGQGLCREHHGVKTQEEQRGVYFDTRSKKGDPKMNRRKTLAAVVALVAAGAIGGLLTGRAKATHFPEPHDPPCGYIELDGNEWVHVDAIRRVTPGRIHLLGAHSQGSPNYVDTSLSIEGVGELIALERAICGP